MSGDRGLRWPQHARAPSAGALLVALLSALALVASHSGWVPSLGGGSRPAPYAVAPPPRMTVGELPQAAIGPVSAALGSAEPSYHVHPAASGARALNRGQGFAASFSTGGVRVSSGSLALSLHTTSAGFGNAPAALAAVRPQVSSNRVTYNRAGVREWYANGPFGLEQGFSVARPGGAQQGSVYTVSMALSATTRATLTRDGSSVLLRGPAGRTLRYGGLRAVDAANRLLASWLSLSGQTLSLHVRTAGARFPVSIDPLLTGEGLAIELGQAPGEAPEKPAFGTSVALSGDGTTALIGAPDGELKTGAAWIFHREGAVWSQQGGKLTGPPTSEEGACEGEEVAAEEEPVSCAFGYSVALDEKGDTALIGAPAHGTKPGVAWVLNRTGSKWIEEKEPLTGPTENGQADFGFSVALSSDGNHALVGAPAEHGGRGAAYVFERVAAIWSAGASLPPTGEGAGGHLGFSVALSADGQEAIAGAPLDAGHKGTAFVFEHLGNSWVQNGSPLTGTNEPGEGRFGETVAMAGNGSTVLVGGPAENTKLGAVWTFVFVTGRWNPFGPKLVGEGKTKEEFGRGLALSADGSTALVGAPKAHAQMRGEGAGVIRLYQASKSEWKETQALEAGPLEKGNGQFGKSVSMTDKGETVLVGAPHESFKAGTVWLFGERPTVEELKTSEEGKEKAKGHLAGGNKIWVVGKNLSKAVGVWFGDNVSLTIEQRIAAAQPGGPEKLVVIAPPGDEPGEVDVTVETEDWLSAVTTADQYLYVRTAAEEEAKGGGGGGGGPKGHPGKNNEESLESILHPQKTTTTTTTNKNGVLPNKSNTTPSCAVSLRSSKISVAGHARATIALSAHGNGSCAGRITLQVSVKKGKRTQTKTIASGTYSATAGRNLSIALKLNSTGQGLLRAGHGHLKAKLLIGRSTPTALKASTTNVTLSLAKKKKG